MLKCSFVCALLSVAPRTKQMKLTTKTFRRAIGSGRSSHNPGDGGERAVAVLADASRAAGRESRRAAG